MASTWPFTRASPGFNPLSIASSIQGFSEGYGGQQTSGFNPLSIASSIQGDLLLKGHAKVLEFQSAINRVFDSRIPATGMPRPDCRPVSIRYQSRLRFKGGRGDSPLQEFG